MLAGAWRGTPRNHGDHVVQRRHTRVRPLQSARPEGSRVVRAAARRRNRQVRELVAWNVGRRLRGMGPKSDLARDSRGELLPLDAGARQAGARTPQGAEMVGGALQRWVGRPDRRRRVLREIAE